MLTEQEARQRSGMGEVEGANVCETPRPAGRQNDGGRVASAVAQLEYAAANVRYRASG
jgi:hypothetical protein